MKGRRFSMSISECISMLADYAQRSGLIENEDRTYAINALADALGGVACVHGASNAAKELSQVLASLCDYAVERGIIKDTPTERDLFDTRLMGLLTPRPSEVIRRFEEAYRISPMAATAYFYALAENSNYIRKDRIEKDIKWSVPTEFGELELTVNLSKPEKDPREIARSFSREQSGYPRCLLCPENEGFAGDATRAARQNLRLMPITLAGERWFLQYSPYVYYNEHCIALSAEHTPMSVGCATFERMFDFLDLFPHYFIGSNADLPIVGGSILSHEHMQGGCYSFAMERAPIEEDISFLGYGHIGAGILKWPMSVIRLSSFDRISLSELALKILDAWRGYTDEAAFIFASSGGEAHNTITPIARKKNDKYELDLVLRSNITTNEHPLGVYHPHAEHHNIKKENIGLIEVMGLAVLPSRLKAEMDQLRDAVLDGRDLSSHPQTAKHKEWFLRFADKHAFSPENTEDILRGEIGNTFLAVLRDAGVFKRTSQGRASFLKFIDEVNKK